MAFRLGRVGAWVLFAFLMGSCDDGTRAVWTASAEGTIRFGAAGAPTPLVLVLPFTAGGSIPPEGRVAFGWSLADAAAEADRTVEIFVGIQFLASADAGTYSFPWPGPGQPLATLDVVAGPTGLLLHDWVPVTGSLTIRAWQCAPDLILEADIQAEFTHPSIPDERIFFTGSLVQQADAASRICRPLE